MKSGNFPLTPPQKNSRIDLEKILERENGYTHDTRFPSALHSRPPGCHCPALPSHESPAAGSCAGCGGPPAAAGRGRQRQNHRAYQPGGQSPYLRSGQRYRRGPGMGRGGGAGLSGGLPGGPLPGGLGGGCAAVRCGACRALVGDRHHLHQQGCRRAEGAAGADVRHSRPGHLGRHLPLRLHPHPAPGRGEAGRWV